MFCNGNIDLVFLNVLLVERFTVRLFVFEIETFLNSAFFVLEHSHVISLMKKYWWKKSQCTRKSCITSILRVHSEYIWTVFPTGILYESNWLQLFDLFSYCVNPNNTTKGFQSFLLEHNGQNISISRLHWWVFDSNHSIVQYARIQGDKLRKILGHSWHLSFFLSGQSYIN